MASYIPTRNADLLAWLANFSTLITATPLAYGLQTSDATTIAAENSAYSTAYTLATDPSTRTRATVAGFSAAKAHALSIVRPYAQQIANNLGVTNEQKASLGLTVRDTSRTPVPPPTTQPVLSIAFAQHLQMTLRFADVTTPTSRAKPAGVTTMVLAKYVGVAVATDPESANLDSLVTVQPVNVAFDSGDQGKICTFFARWANRKGQLGPWSAGVHMTIP